MWSSRSNFFAVRNGKFRALYEAMIVEGKIKRDPRQDAVVTLFQNLGDKLEGRRGPVISGQTKSTSISSWPSFWSSTSSRSPDSSQPVPSQGLYIHGGCGTGKTMLMDLFFTNLDFPKKKRVHFHEYMIDVHSRLFKLQKNNSSLEKCDTHWTASSAEKKRLSLSQKSTLPQGDLCERVANELFQEAEFLCFDEFQVTFISDAVIMRRLFSYLFDKGVVIVATSNRPPDDLYLNGLNRELFVPFIPLLKQRCIVHNMDSSVDYRQLTTAPHNQVFFPQGGNEGLESKFFRLARNQIDFNNMGIDVQGRTIAIRRAAKNSSIAWFTFHELCDKPLGSADYISIAKKFHTVFIENIPKLTIGERDQVRRFITLIDALYDNHVRLVCSSAADNLWEIFTVDELTKKNSSMDEVFAWDRTVSRLIEMCSEEYQIKHCRGLSVDEFYGQFDLSAANSPTEDLQEIFVRYDKNNDKVIALAGLNRMLNEINTVLTHHHPDKVLTASEKLRKEMCGSANGTRVFYDKFEKFVNSNGGLVSALLNNSDMQ